MRFAEIPVAHRELWEKHRRNILKEFGVEETAIKILNGLSKEGLANVYEISKNLPDAGHYSTILRALRRLERNRLVKKVEGVEMARGQIFYGVTALGEMIAALGKGGWTAAANVLAVKSTSFVECMKAHRPLYPNYYVGFTDGMIRRLRMSSRYKGVKPNLEKLAQDEEYDWIAANIIEVSYAPPNRPSIFEDLVALSSVDWIRAIVIDFIEEHVKGESEWLRTLDDFRRRLVATDKDVKLTKFLE